MKKIFAFILLSAILLTGCQKTAAPADGKLNVVATTTMIADLVRQIGGDHVQVTGLMQAGVDPHLYKAKESDVNTLQKAELVFFNGIHLEAKLDDILSKLPNSVKLENGLASTDIRTDDAGGKDPHIWFDVSLWKKAAAEVAKGLATKDPQNKETYNKNLKDYLVKLDELDVYIKKRSEEVPKEQRILITAHDAFNYFAAANGFEVKAIQGISTESEASTTSVSSLASFIAEHKIKAIFIESSVPLKTIEALQAAVKAQGFDVKIGGELHSDSLKENTDYIGTFKENIDTIVDALK